MPFVKLADSDYPKRQSLVVCSWGEEKTHKTFMALTFPKPLHFFNFNYGLSGVSEAFTGQDITIWEPPIKLSVMSTEADYEAVYRDFKASYDKSVLLLAKEAGTVVVDTATEAAHVIMMGTLAELRRTKYKRLGIDWQPMGLDYGPRNAAVHSMYTSPMMYPRLNAVFTHMAKDRYGKDDQGKDVVIGRMIDSHRCATYQTHIVGENRKKNGVFEFFMQACRVVPEMDNKVVAPAEYDMLAAICRVTR